MTKHLIILFIFLIPFFSKSQTLQQVTNNGRTITVGDNADFIIYDGGVGEINNYKLKFRVFNTNEAPAQFPTLNYSYSLSQYGGFYGDLLTFRWNGNIGIGTYKPVWGKVNISINNGQQSITQNNSLLALEDDTYTTAGSINSRINWINANGIQIASIYSQHNAYANNNGDLVFGTNNSNGAVERMRICSTGDIYIGNAESPDHTLYVNGKVHTKEVKVYINEWPDYVFQPDYNIKTLPELKDYVDTHKRLPDMPSEQEVEKSGIELGGMNKLLVKKIEELTIYLIEKDKQITEQQKKNNDQDARIAVLEKALAKSVGN